MAFEEFIFALYHKLEKSRVSELVFLSGFGVVWTNKFLFFQNLLIRLVLVFVFYSLRHQCLQQLVLAVITTTLELQKFESYCRFPKIYKLSNFCYASFDPVLGIQQFLFGFVESWSYSTKICSY